MIISDVCSESGSSRSQMILWLLFDWPYDWRFSISRIWKKFMKNEISSTRWPIFWSRTFNLSNTYASLSAIHQSHDKNVRRTRSREIWRLAHGLKDWQSFLQSISLCSRKEESLAIHTEHSLKTPEPSRALRLVRTLSNLESVLFESVQGLQKINNLLHKRDAVEQKISQFHER